jgi:plastocyanin
VRYSGEVPPPRQIDMAADPGCAKKHGAPVASDVLILGPQNALANVFVHVKSGLPGGAYAPAAEPVVIDQVGCRYDPHVVGLLVGQELIFKNSDGLLHNVHALPRTNKTFNMAMPATRTEASVVFTQPEFMFTVKCDVHPWMGAYVAVMPHPFFAVTKADGLFELGGLPAGTYEVEAWHEKLSQTTLAAEVQDGQSVELQFTLTR